MQLGSSAIPLLPAVAVGAAVVLVAVVLWGVCRARKSPPEVIPSVAPLRDATPAPVAEDWTGEMAGGPADPPARARRVTVADAVAARWADTEPLPAAHRAAGPPHGDAWLDAPPVERTVGMAHSDGPAVERAVALPHSDSHADAPAEPWAPRGFTTPAAPGSTVDRTDVDTAGDGGMDTCPEPTGSVRSPEPVDEDRPPATLRIVPGPPSTRDATPRATGPEPSGTGPVGGWRLPDEHPAAPSPVPPPWSDVRRDPAPVPDLDVADDPPYAVPVHGPAEPVSRAVRQALAARAVQRARRHGDTADPALSDPALSDPALSDPLLDPALVDRVPTGTVADIGTPATDPRRTDARDRLLAVLLDDPARALGATAELDDTRDRIDRLGSVLRRRRADLAVAVQRLHDSGLTGEQIGRLSGLDGEDVRELLDRPDGADGG